MTFQAHQVVAGFTEGDAISNEARAIRSVLRSRGYRSEIYACRDFIQPNLNDSVSPLEDLNVSSGDLVIYHHSIGSPAGDLVRALSCPRVMIHHNVTPPRLIRPYDSRIASQLEWGQRQLRLLKGSFELALADSSFSEEELKKCGYARTGVLPILLDDGHFSHKPDRRVRRKCSDDLFNILFVGRLAPNKNAHQLVRVFSIYQKFINARSRLLLIGSGGAFQGYYYGLQNMVRDLQLKDVVFGGHVTQSQLVGYYSVGDVFLCLSEHEGFCVPIIESFRYRVPVIALSRAAVPATVGEAGLLLDSAEPAFVAEALEYVRTTQGLQKKLADRGAKRFEENYSPAAVRARLEGYLDRLLAGSDASSVRQ